jgi:hypothetical protein
MIRKTYNKKFNSRKPTILRNSYVSRKVIHSHDSSNYLNNYLVYNNNNNNNNKRFEILIHKETREDVVDGNFNMFISLIIKTIS